MMEELIVPPQHCSMTVHVFLDVFSFCTNFSNVFDVDDVVVVADVDSGDDSALNADFDDALDLSIDLDVSSADMMADGFDCLMSIEWNLTKMFWSING
jgi:hypothetical protein